MPEVQEVFRLATQKVRPEPGALERQLGQRRRRTFRRKVGVYSLVAALLLFVAVVVGRGMFDTADPKPAGQPSTSPAPEDTAPFATVTFDGSTCSMVRTADGTPAGIVVFEVVNATDQRAMFDTWELMNGYTFGTFEDTIERDHHRAELGKPGHGFPGEEEVTYLGSRVIAANDSGYIAETMSPGRHAIVCLKPYTGEGFRPFGIVGPIVVR
jgi:hypothetical protein